MDTFETLVLVVHVLAALAIIGLVLIQHGKGADMGSGFGAGSGSTVFGSGGASNFMTRLTTIIAITFFLTSFGLAFYAKERSLAVRDLGIPVVADEAKAEDPEEGGAELPTFEVVPLNETDLEIPE